MPKPKQGVELTFEQLRAEVDAAVANRVHHNRVVMTQLQCDVLSYAIEAGLTVREISVLWKKQASSC